MKYVDHKMRMNLQHAYEIIKNSYQTNKKKSYCDKQYVSRLKNI